MFNHKYHLVPGPTIVPQHFITPYANDYGSSDTESAFFAEYRKAQGLAQTLLSAQQSSVVIFSGEAMVALWGALKSVIKAGDKVLAVGFVL